VLLIWIIFEILSLLTLILLSKICVSEMIFNDCVSVIIKFVLFFLHSKPQEYNRLFKSLIYISDDELIVITSSYFVWNPSITPAIYAKRLFNVVSLIKYAIVFDLIWLLI